MRLFEKHIFVCINERVEGAPRVSCGETNGKTIVAKFKELITTHKLKIKVRAQRASCFDWCEEGPIVTVYPEGVVYGKVSLNNVEEIFEQHILNNQPVKHLKASFSK